MTWEESKSELLTKFGSDFEPAMVEVQVKRILEAESAKNNKFYEGVMEKHKDVIENALRMYEFNTFTALFEALPKKLRSMAARLTRDIRKEYKCQNVVEESLAEVIALNFARILQISQAITVHLTGTIDIGEQNIKFYNFLSKELDRANRQYLSALSMLQQLKSPALKVSLKAETAIVGQNQQLNAVVSHKELNIKDSNSEINKS